MISASRGCSRYVVFLGRKKCLMFVKLFWKVSGKQVALSQNKTTWRFSKHILLSGLDKILFMMPESIQEFLLEKQWADIGFNGSLQDLKQRGPFDLQIKLGTKKKEPSEATLNITVIRYLDFLPPLVFFPFSIKPFTGKVLKNIQACLNLICFVVQNPSITLVIVQSKLLLLLWKPHRLIHKIFSLTLYICFHFSNHLFEAEKLVNSSFTSRFTISIAFY